MQWFYNLRIATKLALSFLLVLILMLGMGLFSIMQISQLNHIASVNIIQEWMPNIISASDMNTNTSDFRIAEFQHINSPDKNHKDRYGRDMQDALTKFAKNTKDYEVWISSDAERAIYDEFKSQWAAYLQEHDKLIDLSRNNKNDEAVALIRGDSQKLFDDASANLVKIIKINVEGSDKSGKESQAAYASSRLWISGLLAGSVVLGLLLAFFISRQISGSINTAVTVASTVASGDLTSNIVVTTKDETGSLMQALSNMQGNLRDLISQIQVSADSISTGAQQISAGNTDLSQRTEEQASSLEETASSMEEMASTVKQNAENARQANVLASEASNVAVKGGVVVSEVVSTMADINTSSKKIVDIISVIDGIAFQTNILALNAAVEAARAGEQGRGFAVVAAEVRSLAQRSASAAKEIKQLIGDSVEKVAGGTQLVAEAGKTMQEIVASVKKVTDIVNEIAAASQEQSAGIDQVNNAITNMDQVTQQNAALVEEASAAASSLESKAQELVDATNMFTLRENSHQRVFNGQATLDEKQHDEVKKELNQVRTPRTKDLPKTKQSRLKAPKTKTNEEWEEF